MFPPNLSRQRDVVWEQLMSQALIEAKLSAQTADVPVGAVVVNSQGQIVARAHNQREADTDPTAHAEILALRQAATNQPRPNWRLAGHTLVVTLEPCLMCAGALLAARVDRVVFGAWDTKAGACGSVWDVVRDSAGLHKVEVITGIREIECAEVLADFFSPLR